MILRCMHRLILDLLIHIIFDKVLAMEKLAYDMHVTSSLGHNSSVNSVYRNCPIVIQAREFLADLITLPL